MRCCLILALMWMLQTVAAAPTTLPADVQQFIEAIKPANATGKAMEMKGTLSRDFDVAGEKKSQSLDFTASAGGKGQFLHQLKDEMRLGADGKVAYLYAEKMQRYHQEDLEDGKLSDEFRDTLAAQNPLLVIYHLGDPASLLSRYEGLKFTAANPADPASHDVISALADGASVRFFFDAKTHVLRRVETDVAEVLKKEGVPLVNKALVTIEYRDVEIKDSLPEEVFAWTVPAGAREFEQDQPAGDKDSQQLVGATAPAFKLKGMDDKEVALADLKGSVVVLDFWATWCGPCVASMPALDAIHKEFSEKGLKLFALNLREEKKTVEQFLAAKSLSLPVLLDEQGRVANQYAVSGIPQTVVIGKDGVIRKVFVGFGGDDAPLRSAIEAALSE